METLQNNKTEFSEISQKEVVILAGRKKFLGEFQKVTFNIPEKMIPVFEELQSIDPSGNKNKIIRTALEHYFKSLPELQKLKKVS